MPNRPIGDVIAEQSVIAVSTVTTVREVAQLMQRRHVSAVLVVDRSERLAGICTERDIVFEVIAASRDPDQTRVAEIMTHAPRTITVDKPFGHALHLMYEGGFRHVPVVDQRGYPVGIVTARDALALDAREFERELVHREEITVIL